MRIDARDIELQDLFAILKEALASGRGAEVFIEVLTEKSVDAGKIKSFAAMSGCISAVEDKEECFIVRITGSPCCT